MKKVKYYLKNEVNDRGDRQVYGRVNYDNKSFKFGTGISVEDKYWDGKQQRVKMTKSFPLYQSLNQRLNKLEEIVQSVYYNAMASQESPTKMDFLKALNPDKYADMVSEKTTLLKYLDSFHKERKGSGLYAVGSAKVYNNLRLRFVEFCDHAKYEYDWKDIDLNFFYRFVEWFYSYEYSTNYIAKVVSTLKTVLTDAKERGINKYTMYEHRKFTVHRAKSTKIYLTDNEVMKLFNHQYGKGQDHLRNAADWLCIAAWSGLRESDFSKMMEEHIHDYKDITLISTTSEKGKKAQAVPLHDGIKEILRLRGIPNNKHQQNLNRNIKDACKIAGIDEKVVIYKSIASKQVSNVKYKWEEVTTHTGRRSFATNMFLRGYTVEAIGTFMGHAEARTTWGYICAAPEEIAYKAAVDRDGGFFRMGESRNQ